MKLLFLLLWLIPATSAQISIDDIISGALSLVKPIFDTSRPIQNDAMLPKSPPRTSSDVRDSSILGTHQSSVLDDLPLCKGNSRVCQFISCSASNFKKNPTFTNLQLAADVLGDTKLRKAISNNPEAINAVCEEQGMTAAECSIFKRGFQLIDRFITTIEKPENGKADTSDKVTPLASSSALRVTRRSENEIQDDDYDSMMDDAPAAEPPKAADQTGGSHTWSSRPQTKADPAPIEPQLNEVSSWTPLPFMTFAPFVPPSIPTAPPLAFPTVPSMLFPPFTLPTIDPKILDPFGLAKNELRIRRLRRDVRERRGADYYDEVEHGTSAVEGSGDPLSTAHDDSDYASTVERVTTPKTAGMDSGTQNCMNLLIAE